MIHPSIIAAAIADAPAWAIVSLTVPDEQLRHAAADELGRWIAERIDPPAISDRNQLHLPL